MYRPQSLMILFSITLFLFPHVRLPAKEQIHVRIEGFSKKKARFAIVPFQNKSANKATHPNLHKIQEIISNDLNLTGWVHIINPKAFLGNPIKEGYNAKQIVFKNWRAIDALYLIKGWVEMKDKKLTVGAYLYDVTAGKILESRKYTGSVSTYRWIGHTFANLVVEVLTGETGIFTTKIACIMVTKKRSKMTQLPHTDPTLTSIKRQPQYEVVKEIVTMDFDGENLAHITHSGSKNLSPSWSRDGTKIAYTCRHNLFWEICVADMQKRQLQPITNLQKTVISPRFSPVNDLLAASIVSEKEDEIYLFNLNGKVLRRLTKSWNIDVSPAWSPDGKQIAFTSARTGRPQIYTMNSDGTNQKRIIFDGKNNETAAWSPKNDKIAFAGLDDDGEFDIFLMNPDGTDIERLTDNSGNNEYPNWSPDGRFIVFSSTRSGSQQIYIMNRDGSNQRRLTNFRGSMEFQSPAWSPRF